MVQLKWQKRTCAEDKLLWGLSLTRAAWTWVYVYSLRPWTATTQALHSSRGSCQSFGSIFVPPGPRGGSSLRVSVVGDLCGFAYLTFTGPVAMATRAVNAVTAARERVRGQESCTEADTQGLIRCVCASQISPTEMVHDGVNPGSGVWLSVSLSRQGPVLISEQHPNRGTDGALPTPHSTRQRTITPTATNPCIISDYSKERQHWINSSSMEWDVSTKLRLNQSANHVQEQTKCTSVFVYIYISGIPKISVFRKSWARMAVGQVHQCVAWDINRRPWESGAEGG